MDHLPSSTSDHHPVKVPYLGGPIYDNQGFSSYPDRVGWNTDELSSGRLGGRDREAAAAFLQQWLFFGLISQVLDTGLDLDQFVIYDAGVGYVSTRQLPRLIRERRQREDDMLFDAKTDWYNSAWFSIQGAGKFMDQMVTSRSQGALDLQNLPSAELELSIYVMLSFLHYEIAHTSIVDPQTRRVINERGITTCDFLIQDMLRDGWCPSHVNMLALTLDALAMYYAHLLGPPKMKKDHSQCSRNLCFADQIVEETYKTLHVDGDACGCCHVGPDTKGMIEILEADSIPLISIVTDSGFPQNIELNVQRARPELRYIAISHVWSGGLGNPSGNSLTKCQLLLLRERLAALAAQVSLNEPIFFWMDTLCVPVHSPSHRNRAITAMKRTYREAAAVLVLDSELVAATHHCGHEESLMRITCSSWLRRLWTFQEGMLAEKIFFQFEEGAVDLDKLWDHLYWGTIYDRRSNGIAIQASRFHQNLKGFRSLNRRSRLVALLDALQWRQTSHMSDETICVAALLNLDMEELLRTPVEHRMKKILELQRDYLPGMLFLAGSRMQEPGYRWAPWSFMSRRGNEILDMVNREERMQCVTWTPDGLQGHYDGLVLLEPAERRQISEPFRLKCEMNGAWYIVRRILEPHAENNASWNDVLPPQILGKAAIVLKERLISVLDWYTSLGILGDIDQEDEICSLRYRCRVEVQMEAEHTWPSWDQRSLAAECGGDGQVETIKARARISENWEPGKGPGEDLYVGPAWCIK